MKKKLISLSILIIIWILTYSNLEKAINYLFWEIFRFEKNNHLIESIRFFVYEVPKVFLLLILIVFVVGIIRTYFSPESTRRTLQGKSLFGGNILASLLGIVTPFCSCSAIPLFLGFVESGVPLGVTFSFLISAPMINEVALVLLFGLFGWETALLYMSTGLLIAIFSGWIIGKMKLEGWIQDWVFKVELGNSELEKVELTLNNRIDSGVVAVKEIISKVWIYIIIGIGVGAGVHGYVPADFMASFMGKDVWYSVPAAVILGIPMYSNAAGIVPIVQVLLSKGASLGTSLAFMMSVIALSLPEAIILKKVLKIQLLITFFSVVGLGIMIVGFLFNIIF